MGLIEEGMFYQSYVVDVTSVYDMEGDPRNLRITPETFKAWALGAKIGDSYVIDDEIFDPSRAYKPSVAFAKRLRREKSQIDLGTAYRKPSRVSKLGPPRDALVYTIDRAETISGYSLPSNLSTPTLVISHQGLSTFQSIFDRELIDN